MAALYTGRVTIADVARHAGVAKSTVSAVVRNNGRVGAQTRARVLGAAEELGYRPSRTAQALSLGATRNIGALYVGGPGQTWRETGDLFLGEALHAGAEVAGGRGYHLSVLTTTREAIGQGYLRRLLQERHVDGLLVLSYAQLEADDVADLQAARLPFVLLGQTLVAEPAPHVRLDNFRGAEMAVDYLVSLGHRRVAMVAPLPTKREWAARAAGFWSAAGRHRLGDAWAASGLVPAVGVEAGLEAGRRLLSGHRRPTAVFGFNDYTAVGVIRAARVRGLRVPDDLSVVGFDNHVGASISDPGLTTVDHRIADMGAAAVELLLSLIAGRTGECPGVVLEPALVVRESCAPPADRAARRRPTVRQANEEERHVRSVPTV
ncbi:MAG TPA: LacI family DNA-binding transcriptional regulator [Chloroflexota bacterium]|nr:LacI family DNA-binding transcriptional regulator [Chloroflexota bacterium]